MARIRTIKPEFVESESIGRLSREGRLLFIQLWLFVDDSGRARASSRLLASRLYPYDEDAPALIDGWLAELAEAGHIRLYAVDGDAYLDIPKWLKHQKIDRPTPSRIPQFYDELASPREPSRALDAHTLDLGPVPRTMDLGPESTPEGVPSKQEATHGRSNRGTRLPDGWRASEALRTFAIGLDLSPDDIEAQFTDYWRAVAGAKGIKLDWDATWRNWCRNQTGQRQRSPAAVRPTRQQSDVEAFAFAVDRLERKRDLGQ